MAKVIRVKTNAMQTLRELHKKNETGMAKTIGCSRNTYIRAMNGENVSAAFVAGAAVGLGVPFDTLFYVTDNDAEAAA